MSDNMDMPQATEEQLKELVESDLGMSAEQLIEEAQIAEAIEERHAALAGEEVQENVAVPTPAIVYNSPEAKFESYVEALTYFAYKAKETAPGRPAIINAIAKLEQAINELR